jgi:transcriptional regulator with XRE-family HTH domain
MYRNNLRALRRTKGLNQVDISQNLAVGQAEFSRIESGKRPIGQHLNAIAKALNVTPEQIKEEVVDANNDFPKTETEMPVYGYPCSQGCGLNFKKTMMSRVDCPPELEGIDGAYASFCFGNALSPKISNGDLAFVNPTIEPKVGSLVIVRTKVENARRGFMGLLLSYDKAGCVVETTNPQEEIEFSRDVESVDQIVMVKYDL